MQADGKGEIPHNYREAKDWIEEFINAFNEAAAKVEDTYAAHNKSFWKGNKLYGSRNSLVFNPKDKNKRRPLSRKEFQELCNLLDEALTPETFDIKTRKIERRESIIYPDEIESLEAKFSKYEAARKYLDARSNPNIISLPKDYNICTEKLERILSEHNFTLRSIGRLEGLVDFLDQAIQIPRSQARYREAAKAAHTISVVLRDRPNVIGLPSREIAAARMNTLIRGARAAMQGSLVQVEDKMVAEMQELRGDLPATVKLRTLTHQGYIKGTWAPVIALAIADVGVKQEMFGYYTSCSGMLHNASSRLREFKCGMFECVQELGGRSPDQAWREDLQQCESECDPESAAFTSGRWAEELAWEGHFREAYERIEHAQTLIKRSGLNLVVASRRLERARGLIGLAEFKFSRSPSDLVAATDVLRHLMKYYETMGHADAVNEINEAFARAMGNPSL